ncbi:ATP-binding protein [Palleronia rufa]|uniref:sensor histidine kinase n=1 Tax=Palleronia rufa TaxID=1530186 RepID=UPI00055B6611|nr:ATP-binding protein [Palleronia rufa]
MGRGLSALVLCLGLLGLGAVSWPVLHGRALDRLAQGARADLDLAADALVSLLQQYRETAVLAADYPSVVAAAAAGAGSAEAEARLGRIADKTDLRALRLVARDGRVLSAAGPPMGPRAGGAPLDRALTGALGRGVAVVPPGAPRLYEFAAPVFAPGGGVLGAVLAGVDLDRIDRLWRGAPEPLFFATPAGEVLISNRAELGAVAVRRIGVRGHELWRIDGARELPERALVATRDLPVVGLTGSLLADTAPAVRAALAQLAGVLAAAAVAGAMILTGRARLRAEALAARRLERQVAARTAELRAANAGLTREIAERREAEAALERAQDDLVQAGKLAALGQLAAGLGHELNQPLMAVRSYAENAAAYLERGRPERAAESLGRISEMARRMGRIIRSLRAFARAEDAAVADVDLTAVIEAVADIVRFRARAMGARVDWPEAGAPVWVRGGEVRLQQVLLNLVTNALDAVEGRDGARVSVRMAAGDPVRLTVRDNGPGIAEPGRMFDPFYSTKDVGKAEGMGLGLSISHRLASSFGGELTGRNLARGGALFELRLRPARLEAAA